MRLLNIFRRPDAVLPTVGIPDVEEGLVGPAQNSWATYQHPVRCESGYVLLGDPCYFVTGDSSSVQDYCDDLRFPQETLECGKKNYAQIGGSLGLLLKVPSGTHTVITLVDVDSRGAGEVQELCVRFDGGKEPFVFGEGLLLEGAIAVDAGIVGVHDPALTMFAPGGHHWKTWDEFCTQMFTPDNTAQQQEGKPVCPDDSNLLAYTHTAYGDGVYDASLFFDDAGGISAVMVRFIWMGDDEDDDLDG